MFWVLGGLWLGFGGFQEVLGSLVEVLEDVRGLGGPWSGFGGLQEVLGSLVVVLGESQGV